MYSFFVTVFIINHYHLKITCPPRTLSVLVFTLPIGDNNFCQLNTSTHIDDILSHMDPEVQVSN